MKQVYVLMQGLGDSLRFRGEYDSYLCPWGDLNHFLSEYLERHDFNDDVTIKFTVMEMDDEDLDEWCRANEVEYN